MNSSHPLHVYDLLQSPELASVHMLRTAPDITSAALAGSIDGLCFQDALHFHPSEPRKLIGHLLIDRCREIAELATAYQQAGPPCLQPQDSPDPTAGLPF
jgi:hypothetical protein